MRWRSLAALAVSALLCAWAPRVRAGADAPDPAQLKLGKKIYRDSCAGCHGTRGEGNGAEARAKGYHPRNFTYGAFKCRCTPTGSPPADEDLLRTVTVEE